MENSGQDPMQEERKGHAIEQDQRERKQKRKQARQIWAKTLRKKKSQHARQIRANLLRNPSIQIKKNSSTPNLVKPNNNNDFQTMRYSQKIPLQEN